MAQAAYERELERSEWSSNDQASAPSNRHQQRVSLLSEYLRSRRNDPGYLGHRVTDDNDDYVFLDEDENMEDEDVMGSGGGGGNGIGNGRGRREAIEDDIEEEEIDSDLHVIYRRKDSHLDHNSDYRESKN